MSLEGKNDNEKLACLLLKNYKDQAVWFLNAFWETVGKTENERIWGYVQKLNKIDLQKHEAGNGVDEVQAHKFLEELGETLTVMAMREKLRQTGAISQNDRPKLVPLIHYLLFRYNVDWHALVNCAGDKSEEMKKAQKLLDEVLSAFKELDIQAKEARRQEAPFKAAQEEVDAALCDVKSQEDARNSKTEQLKKQSEEGSIVQQNKAKALLASHLNEDPLPLRKAKITLEAALKKAEKARAPFEAARKRAEDAADAAQARVQEAEAYLEEIKRKPGSPFGAIWWMERELNEQKAYLPERKGGLKKVDTVKV
jgi:DNA repair exonuclease SbcCD ATPase subunit